MSRGMEPFVIGVVLMGIIIFLFVVAGPALYSKGKDYFQSGTCQDSIERAIKLGTIAETFSNKIRCPTRAISFAATTSGVQAQVRSELVDCWKQWHEGTTGLFSISPLNEEKFCDVCTNFAEGTTQQVPIDLSATREGDKTTQEYLQSVTVIDGVVASNVNTVAPATIDTSQPYAVVFWYARAESQQPPKTGIPEVDNPGGDPFMQPSSREQWSAGIQLIPHTESALKALGCTYYPVSQR